MQTCRACSPAIELEAAYDAALERTSEVDFGTRVGRLAGPVDGAPKIPLDEQAQLGDQRPRSVNQFEHIAGVGGGPHSEPDGRTDRFQVEHGAHAPLEAEGDWRDRVQLKRADFRDRSGYRS